MHLRKVIGLLRVSSEAQAGADRQGLPAQRHVCERVALTHDLEIIDWVQLEGVSGAAVLGDRRFEALLTRLSDPQIAGIVAADFDRLFRRGRFADYAILDAFADTGSLLFTADTVLDPMEDTGGLLGVLRGELAGMERRAIAERTRRGREELRKRGLRAEGLVGMPRGVNFDPTTGTWSYVYPEAERVRLAFDLFLGGESNLAAISRATGIGTKTDTSTAIMRVLSQPLYSGVYRVDRRWVDGKPRPREAHEVIAKQVIDPPLVSPAEFEQVQALLRERRDSRPLRTPQEAKPGVYGGFLTCALCGASMQQQRDSKGYWGYLCGSVRTRGCTTGQTSIRVADPQIGGAMELILGDRDNLTRLIEKSAERLDENRIGPAPRDVQRTITTLENKRRRAKDAYMAGVFDLSELEKRTIDLNGELTSLQRLVDRQEQPIQISAESVSALVEVFSSWGDLTRDEKRILLGDFGVRVAVQRPRRRLLHVARVEIRSLDGLCLYKKMKRLGIE